MTAGTIGGTLGRIAICAGTHGYAARLAQYLEHDCDLRVVGVCDSGEALIALVGQIQPDLVILDLDLPHGDSVAITRRIVRERLSRVVLIAPHVERQGRRALAGLAAGALVVISQAALDLDIPVGSAAHAVRRGIKRMSMASAHRPANSSPHPRSAPPVDVIGVCASTGGPPVLGAVLGRLPRTFAIPVLVVQHMSPGFTDGLVTWLDGCVAVPVGLAQAGADLAAGVWFAPDGAHLVIDHDRRLGLDTESPAGPHRPSGDALLSSLARVAGSRAAAVVLTGMGADGAAGVAAVAAAGGRTIAQDEATSAVYGMPRVAARRGAARVLSPAAIGDALAAMDHGERRAKAAP